MRNYSALVTGKHFRVYPVSKVTFSTKPFTVEQLPLAKELAIEKRSKDGTYYVVAILKWNPKDEAVTFKDIAMRSIAILRDISQVDLDEYLNCIDFATQTLIDLNEELEDN